MQKQQKKGRQRKQQQEQSEQQGAGYEAPRILSPRQEISEDTIIAHAPVEVIWQEYRIYADYLEYNQKTKDILARGRVTMSSKETVISGDKLRFNLKEKKGEMFDTYGLIMPSVRIRTDRIDQVDNETLKFRKMKFTSCTQLVPRWLITCARGKIKKEKYIEMKHAFIKVKKIPVLYVPYLRYPIKKDGRATGFLFPRLGNSDQRGFFTSNAFFWNIKSNLDLTLYFDYFSKVGVGTAEEFRYLFKNMYGDINYYYFKYFKDNQYQPESTSDYYVNAEHTQNINLLNTKLVFKIDRQSDPNFLRLFDTNFDRMLRNNYRSSFALTSSFSNINFALLASRHETYYTQRDSSRVVETLPSVNLNVNQRKIWKIPGYFSLKASWENVKRSGVVYEYEDPEFTSGKSSQRLNLVPSYNLSLLKLPWLSTALNFEGHSRTYASSLDPTTKAVLDESITLFYYTASAALKGPTFYRIFDSKKKKYKHLIEPQIDFRYVSKLDLEKIKRVVRVDRSDYPSWSYVGFSLSTALLARGKTEDTSAEEIARYTISQQFYFDPAEANFNRKINDEYPEFSELTNNLRLRPFKHFSLDLRASYNYYIKDFSRLNVQLSYNKPDSFIQGSLGYSIYINPYAPPDFDLNRKIIRGNLLFDLPGFPVKLKSGVDYDLTAKEFRYGSVLLTYNYQCINFRFEYRLYQRLSKVESQVQFGVSFGNLGMVSDFLGDKN